MSIYPPTGTLEIKNATLKIPVVDLQYTSNTAKLEANSNVVTEFSRSKKLIKYPRVALNSASQDEYVVTASTDAYISTKFHMYDPFRPFVSGEGTGSANGWHSGPPNISNSTLWDTTFDTSGYNKDVTSYGVGGYAGTSIAEIESEWLKLELPHKIVLSHFYYQQRNGQIINYAQAPRDFRILGSNDDVNWDTIQTFTNQTSLPEGQTLTVEASKGYKYLAFVVTKTWVTSGTSHLTLKNLEYYGVPEYDPEAHGTDVTIKSLPNVPNTDWLEVYYDAKSYSTLPASVNDESGSTNTFNGTIPSGHQITFDDGDIKAFVFPGRDSTTPLQYPDYIQTTLSGWSDNQPHTQSCWFKPTSITSFDQVFGLWDVASTNYEYSAFGIYTDNFAYYHFGSEFRYPYDVSSLIGTWCHISAIHTGYIPDTKVYLNGHLLSGSRTQGSDNTLSLGTAPKLALGKDPGRGVAGQEWAFHGSIANYRLFNRALTSDEIYQLYAYQKEYFGHGDLSMTLKAGRLGIGTSEPRAALDVRGMLNISDKIESPFFKVFSIFDKMNPTVDDSHWSRSIEGTIYAGSSVIVVANVGGYAGTTGGNTWNIQYKIAGTTTWITLSDIFAYFNQTLTHLYRTRTFVWKPTEDIHFIEWRITTTLSCNTDDKIDLVLVSLPV